MKLDELLELAGLGDRKALLSEPLAVAPVIERMFVLASLAAVRPDLDEGATQPTPTWADVAAWTASAESAVVASQILGRRIVLAPVFPADVPAMFEAAMSPGDAHRWRYRGRTVDLTTFDAEMNGGVLAQFVARAAGTGESQGVVIAYNADLSNGHCYVAIQRVACASAIPLAMIEACALMIGYVFNHFPMRHIFVEVLEHNAFIARSLESTGLGTRIASYPRHQFTPNGFEDLAVYLIDRQVWRALPERLTGPIVRL